MTPNAFWTCFPSLLLSPQFTIKLMCCWFWSAKAAHELKYSVNPAHLMVGFCASDVKDNSIALLLYQMALRVVLCDDDKKHFTFSFIHVYIFILFIGIIEKGKILLFKRCSR